MHDLVIQRVYATGVSLHVLRGRVDDPFVAERIDSAVDELDRAIKEIRSTIFELHRTSEQGQVAAELAQVVGDVVATLGFAPALTVTGDLDGMPEPLAHDVVAVVREALVNVVRHAQASRVAVTVEARPVAVPAPLSRGGESERSRGTGGAGKSADPSEPAGERSADAAGSDGPRRSMEIRVVVADDGTGLPPRLERRSGLANLAERAIRDGGALDLSPAPRGGTVLTWTGWHDG